MKALKVTVSGSYKTAGGDIVDFEDVSGVIPFVDEEHAKMHVRGRYASEWVRSAEGETGKKIYPDRIEKMRQVFVDDMVEVNENFSYVGKDIKKMTYEELQDLATAKDLRAIPLPKKISGVDIREMRQKAYLDYRAKVMNDPIDENRPPVEYADEVRNVEGGVDLIFNFSKVPELIVDGGTRVETSGKLSNDDIIEQEQKPMMNNETLKDTLTLEDLKKLADDKGIKYHWNVGFEKLYAILFNGAPA